MVYCELVHTTGGAKDIGSSMDERALGIGSSMDERVLLFGLLGLLLTAAIVLAVAPGAVTWAMSLVV